MRGLLLVCLMGLAGCALDLEGGRAPAGGGGTPATGGAPATQTSGGAQPAPGSVEELQQDVDLAVRSTDQFWAAHWAEFFTGDYVPPTVHGYYDGDNPQAGPFCGSQPPVPLNAFYCPSEDLLAWDVDLMTRLFTAGDASVYLVVAHEWAHAIQQRLSAELVTLDAELQADCLAGASLYGSARDGVLLFEEGDEDELARVLAALSDQTAWTDVGDHGSAEQRIGAFSQGGQGGVTACLPQG